MIILEPITQKQLKAQLAMAVWEKDVIGWMSSENNLLNVIAMLTERGMNLNTYVSELSAELEVLLVRAEKEAKYKDKTRREWSWDLISETAIFLIALSTHYPDHVFNGLKNMTCQEKTLLHSVVEQTGLMEDLSSLFTIMGRTEDGCLEEWKEIMGRSGTTM